MQAFWEIENPNPNVRVIFIFLVMQTKSIYGP